MNPIESYVPKNILKFVWKSEISSSIFQKRKQRRRNRGPQGAIICRIEQEVRIPSPDSPAPETRNIQHSGRTHCAGERNVFGMEAVTFCPNRGEFFKHTLHFTIQLHFREMASL